MPFNWEGILLSSMPTESYVLYVKVTDPDDWGLRNAYHRHRPAYEGVARVDLYVSRSVGIGPGSKSKNIELGISAILVEKSSKRVSSYLIVPRSSMSKSKIRLCNQVGVIDSGYRGELGFYVDNVSDDTCYVNRGDHYVQVIAPSLGKIEVILVDSFEFIDKDKSNDNKNVRGSNGLGSSGISFSKL